MKLVNTLWQYYTNFMKKEIFKAYDIRGIYPEEIDEDAVTRIGQAYVRFLSKEWEGVKDKTVVIGCDVRESSPILKQALIEGITSQGVNVIDIGTISTDMIYFAAATLNVDGGITISASHNPAEYNGLKMVRRGATGISGDTGLKDIAEIALSNKYIALCPENGKVETKNILPEYINHVRSFINFEKLKTINFHGKKLRVLLNANFGLGGQIALKIAEGLLVEFAMINCEPDGSFPYGAPNPMLEENRIMMKKAVLENKVDLGVAWDADADRVFFYPSSGEAIEGYFIGSLLAQIILRNHPRENVLHDPRLIWANIEAISSAGGKPITYKTGHMFIKEGMRKYNAIFATEMSAHYYFRDNYYTDNGMIPFLLILNEIITTGKNIAELISTWTNKYFTPGEINFKTPNASIIMQEAEKELGVNGKIDKIDGLSVEFSKWRFNLRMSNTEPLLRLNLEAKSAELMEEKKQQLIAFIENLS